MLSRQRGPRLGTHVSAAGGLFRVVENAEKIGAKTIQIFGASPRQWNVRLPLRVEVEKYHKALLGSSVESVYLHASYLVNLASADQDLYKKSVQNLSLHLKITELIGAKGLIFHLGSNSDSDRKAAVNRIVDGMRAVLGNIPGKSMLLMENSSGGGGKIGASPEEIGELLRSMRSKRAGVCFDTAHAYEAGEIDYTSGGIAVFLKRWGTSIGLENLVVIHANDSKTTFASNADRHENIGQGHIGLRGLKNLAKEKVLWSKDWILEVPGFDGRGPDKQNLDLLRSCFPR
jgi:deoxyribonuclease-4